MSREFVPSRAAVIGRIERKLFALRVNRDSRSVEHVQFFLFFPFRLARRRVHYSTLRIHTSNFVSNVA